ncbi:unnamed protein product [Urochloa humidicola]
MTLHQTGSYCHPFTMRADSLSSILPLRGLISPNKATTGKFLCEAGCALGSSNMVFCCGCACRKGRKKQRDLPTEFSNEISVTIIQNMQDEMTDLMDVSDEIQEF